MNLKKFEQQLMENLIAGVDEYTARMVTRMQRRAPVRKDAIKQPGSRAKAYAVRPMSMAYNARPRYLPKNEQDESRQSQILDLYRTGLKRQLAQQFSQALKLGSTGSASERFVYRSGPYRGEKPAALRVVRGSLQGVGRSNRPGQLRDSIHRIDAVRDGSKIVGGVAVDAPYAAPVEYGFIHKGGRYVRSRPFFRPVWMENRAAGAARLARYVKKAGQ